VEKGPLVTFGVTRTKEIAATISTTEITETTEEIIDRQFKGSDPSSLFLADYRQLLPQPRRTPRDAGGRRRKDRPGTDHRLSTAQDTNPARQTRRSSADYSDWHRNVIARSAATRQSQSAKIGEICGHALFPEPGTDNWWSTAEDGEGGRGQATVN